MLAAQMSQTLNSGIPEKDQNSVKSMLNAFGLWFPDWDRMARFGNAFYAKQCETPDFSSKEKLYLNSALTLCI